MTAFQRWCALGSYGKYEAVASNKLKHQRSSSHVIAERNGYALIGDGASEVVAIQVNGAKLPAPSRSMTSDWIGVEFLAGTVHMTFGQMRLDRAGLLAALVVQMSYRSVFETLFSGDQNTFLEILEKTRKSEGLTYDIPSFSGDKWVTERVAVERARLMSIAFMAEEADVRFYRLSAGDFQAIKAGGANELVYPVVEITLGTRLLCALVDKMQVIVKRVGAPLASENV
jgi:hypothetical protein